MHIGARWRDIIGISWRHFKFFLSRELGYPLVSPDMLQLCFLFRCNLSCKMCSIRERGEIVRRSGLSLELSTETIRRLIEQAAQMGIQQLFLLGGEPFLREDLCDIIRYAHHHRMRTLVTTNGTLLDNARIIDSLLDSKLHSLSISLDGACEDTYRAIRGAGIYEKIINNISLLDRIKKERKSPFPFVTLFCTIMNQNIGELMDIVRLARSLGVAGIGFQPVVADNTDTRQRNDQDPNWIPASRYDVLDKSIDALIEFKLADKDNFKFIFANCGQLRLVKKYFRGTLNRQRCYMGFHRIIISQDGKMYFCAKEPDQGQISFGDVNTDGLRDLWYHRTAAQFRKSIKQCDRPCLLGCTSRDEFIRFVDDLYMDFFIPSQ